MKPPRRVTIRGGWSSPGATARVLAVSDAERRLAERAVEEFLHRYRRKGLIRAQRASKFSSTFPKIGR